MTIVDLFKNLEGYFISLHTDFENGRLVLKLGISKNWVIKTTKLINCVVDGETKDGKIIEIYGIDESINVLNLLNFGLKLVEKNIIIEEKEQEYKKQIEIEKERLKKETEEMYQSLEDFKNKDINLDDESDTIDNTNDDTVEESVIKEKLERS